MVKGRNNLGDFLDRLGNLLIRDGKKYWPVILAVYFLAISPVLILAIYSSLRTYRNLTHLVTAQRLDLARLAATTLEEKLDGLTDLGVSLASRVRFRQLVSAGKWHEAIEILGAVPRDFPLIERSFLTDLDGVLMADSPAAPDMQGKNLTADGWYQSVGRHWRPYISDVYQRRAAPRFNVIAAAIPVKSDDGRPVAILVLQVKLESLLQWAKTIDARDQGSIIVVDRKGNLVAHPEFQLQGKIHDFSQLPAVQKTLQGRNGVEIYKGPDQTQELLMAYHPVARYGWGVVAQQPAIAAYALRDQSMLLASVTYGAIFLFSCALAYLILAILIRAKHGEESRSQLAAIVESSEIAILSKTLDGKIITWNKGAEAIFGYSQDEIVEHSVRVLFPSDAPDEAEYILQRIRRGEVVSHYETKRIRKDGRTIDVALTVSPIRDSKGRIVAAAVISRDISPQKRLQQELQEKNRILEDQYQTVQEANRLKSEFLANMSHELRTPLNAIIGFAQLMHDGRVGPVAPEHKEYLGDILGSGRHLLELINDVLDLAKIDSGKMEFVPELAEITPLVDQVRTILQHQFTGKRLTVETQIAPEVERLTIDPARLKQVLYNYLSNAIKFTATGGQIWIRILSEDEARFRLEVEDSGVGISPERLGELFVEFKQLDPGLSKKYQGTGLGLALTQKIVQAQGGQVGAESTVGRGSRFFAILPKRCDRTERERTEEPIAAINPAHGPRVLVVEDDKEDLRWLNLTLTKAGYIIDCATTGSEAIRQAQTTAYNAILLDLILPDALGWDVLNAIRKLENNHHTPVIAVTVVREKAAAKSFALQDYLSKPVTAPALLGSLRRAGIVANGAGKNILVVDDNHETLRLAAAALQSSGYSASCHPSAKDALAAAEGSSVDAVVLDLLMPDMDGFEFLERFRRLENYADTPVIVWTGKNITLAERDRLENWATAIALKSQGGIDALLIELRRQVGHRAGDARAPS